MKTTSKGKSKPLTKNQIVSAVKDMLLESIHKISNDIFKSIHLHFDKLNKKLDGVNEGTDEIINTQRAIMNKLKDHERRIRELESGFMKN